MTNQTIETDRLILRPLRSEDFEPYAAVTADGEAMRFLGGVQHRAVAWRGFMSLAGSWYLNDYSMFSVVEKSTGAWIGRVGPWKPEGWPGSEIGWGIVRERWGHGYATEAAAAAMDWAFRELGWTEVIHCIAPDNIMSQAVALKLGSRNLGPGKLPPPIEDAVVEIWGQTRDQWQSTRAASKG